LSGSGSGSSSGGAGDGGGGNPVVHLDQKDQTIEGFGINDMYQSSALPASLFDATNGIGLSILRVGMDTNGQGSLESASSMQADIATVNAAGGKVIGSVWTPPAACKTNKSANSGGQLCSAGNIALASEGTNQCSSSDNSSCYNSWATTIASFASSNHLYAMSLANEPEFASCGSNEPCNGTYATAVYTAKEMVAFVKVAGPMLQAKGIKVIAPETSEWNHLWSNLSACGSQPSGLKSSDPLNCGCFISNSSTPGATCTAAASAACSSSCTSGSGYDYGHSLHADSAAWADFDIVGTHEYDDQTAFPWPASEFAKDKEVWVTEMAGVKWWPEQGPSSDINDGVVIATWIHSALVTGEVSAWLWWWYQASGDNEGLVQTGGTDTKRHYTLGNFSKFVRPGYVRVNISGSPPSNVLLSAYSGANTVVIVAINSGSSTASVSINISGGTAPSSCTPWLTSASADLASQTAIPVTGGSLTASVAGPSVTTFVCK
jgi:O-glycosyl hydrolase